MYKQKRKNSDIPHPPARQIPWGQWFGYLLSVLAWPFKAGWQALTWTVQHGWQALTWTVQNGWTALTWTVQNGWTALTWTVQNGWTALTWTVKSSWTALTWTIGGIWKLLRYVVVGHVPDFETQREEFAFWRIKRKYRRRRVLMLHATITVLSLLGMGLRSLDMLRYYEGIGRELPAYVWQQSLIFGVMALVLLGLHAAWVRMGSAEDDDLQQALDESHQKAKRRVYEEHYEEHYDEQYHAPERLTDAVDNDEYYADNANRRIWQDDTRHSQA